MTPPVARFRLADSIVLRYLIPFIVVPAAVILRLALDPGLAWKTPFALVGIAVLLSARFGGLAPGLIATSLGILASDYFFFQPRFSLRLSSSADALNLAAVAIIGIVISVLAGQLRQALIRSLREQDRLEAISDTVPQFIWSTTAAGLVDSMNSRFYQYTGAAPGAAHGTGWLDFVHPDDKPELLRDWHQRLASGEPPAREFRFRRHDGEYHLFDSRVVSVRDHAGKVIRRFGCNTDVQEAHELRLKARAELQRFEQIIAATPGVIFQFKQHPDGASAMPYASPAIRDIFGFSPEALQLDASPAFSLIHPDDREPVAASISASASYLALWNHEFRVLHPQKGELWIVASCMPVREPDGTVNWYGFIKDITERKLAAESRQQSIKQELQLLRSLVEKAPIGVFMLDRALRHVQVSPRWLADVSLSREQVLGKSHNVCFPDLPLHWREFQNRGLAGETLTGREQSYIDSHGRQRCINWQISPWGDQGETTGGIIVYSEDITARKQAEALAQKRETEYRALFEGMTEAFSSCRLIVRDGVPVDYVFLTVNRAFPLVTGLENVVGKTMTEVFGGQPATDPPVFPVFARVALSGRPEKLETFTRRTNEWLSISVYSPEEGCFGVIFEIVTQRRQETLAALHWRRAFEQSASGIGLENAVTDTIESINTPYARKLGYTPEELAGKPCSILYPPEELPRRAEALALAGSAGGHALFESRHVRKDGSRFPVMIDLTTACNPDGVVAGSRVKIVHDLTERKRSEAVQRESEHTIKALLDSADQAILAVNRNGLIVLLNAMACAMFGYPSEALLGRPLSLLLPDEHRSGDLDLLAIRRNGVTFPVEVTRSAVDTEQGPLAITFIKDISSRRQAERDVLELNAGLEQRVRHRTEQLEAANSELESFSYSVSHDLRAPLRGIDGWSLALLEDYGDRLDEQGLKYLAVVRSETQRMGLLIDDLLQLSRVTRTDMHHGPVDLTSAALRVADRLRVLHPDRALNFDVAPGLTTFGDARLLEIVLTNLLDNAVKFTGSTPQPEIALAAAPREDQAGFVVRDNGVGFNPRHSSMIFAPFQRLHKASEFPGSGIGLATVKRIITRHGGHVWAESGPPGATFGFSLPPSSAPGSDELTGDTAPRTEH